MGRSKYAHLLNDEVIRRWHVNLARGSEITADVYLRRLGAFCNENQVTPQALAQTDPRKLEELLMDYASRSEKQYAGSYLQTTIKVVKSWLVDNGVELKRKIKIRGVNETPSLREERVPTKEELRRIFLSASKQARVGCVMLAHGGLRPESIGDYHGSDGLRLGDIPELRIAGSKVEFETVPPKVVVRSSLSKARHQYFTFLSEEGCGYVQDYLEERIRKGEPLSKDSSVVRPLVAEKPFIRTVNIGDMMRLPIRRAGFPWRPYVLRSYFDTQLMLAESKGLVARDYRTFWMGHKGDIENRYTTNKQRLRENVIDDMREAYRRSEPFLTTTLTEEILGVKTTKEVRRQLLGIFRIKPEETENIDSMSDEEFQEYIRGRSPLLKGTMMNGGSPIRKQKVVAVNEAEKLIDEGWEYIGTLDEAKVILRVPESQL